MRRHQLTRAAAYDLDDIWSFIAADNPEAADRVVGRLIEVFAELAKMPLLGV